MSVFKARQFTSTNVVTFLLYAANSGALFLFVVELQTVSGFSPLASALGLVLMARLSPDAGYVADVLPALTVFGVGLASSSHH